MKNYWGDVLSSKEYLAWGEELFFDRLLSLCGKGSKVLEVGVGTGRMVKLLKRAGAEADFYGIDMAEQVLDVEIIGSIGDARKLLYNDNAFDAVYSLGVVEHFPETELAIREQCRVLKAGGYVFTTVPRLSIFSPLVLMRYLFTDRRRQGTFEEIMGRFMTVRQMTKIYRNAGLDVIEASPCGFYGTKRVMRRLHLKWFGDRIQRSIGAYMYIVGRKPVGGV